jgi:hypothetical protein
MIDVDQYQIFLAALGLFTHHVTVLAEMSVAKGKRVGLREYMRTRPYKITLSITGSIIGVIALAQMGELSLLTAFGVGMASSDFADRAGRMALGKMQ